ncbi:GNAT family N-acetyltransferase [Saccharicrinis aurantiacus]|uniref:GNAT family N-acetyltransferase n=1 Tax=Saccharicrinis aurantiacus TaxID=1849719 RepID=UPI0009F8903C|nr:GNAT family protein [Saccharicrinis aurantiacus]
MLDQNIRLRAVEPEDINTLYELENKMELWVASETLVPFSRFQLKQYIASMNNDIYENKELRLIVEIDHNDQKAVAGIIDLFDFDPFHNRAGVGIIVNKKFQNRGVASKALELLIKYSFQHLGIHQLYCSVITSNKASVKLFENKGFTLMGTRKEWRKVANKYEDEFMYQLINNQ